MAFLSGSFFLFWPVTVLVYHLLPRQSRTVWLLLASWMFYLCAGWQSFPFLLGVILLSYVAGRMLEREKKRGTVAAVVAVCVGLLFVLKYLNFTLSLLAPVVGLGGMESASPALKLILPAGISFYLFEAMGYVIDVYRGKCPAQHDFIRYALFLSFFPQVFSGPIARAPQLMPQLEQPPSATWDDLRGGAFRFLWGAFKKLVIADRLAMCSNLVFASPGEYGRLQLLGAAAAFSIQIYCDFSAYSDMALGTARTMGFSLMENFQAPYFSRTIQEFWRRWHISLSSWLRDYLYIPLGGSRKGTARKYLNNVIVFAVSGLWHGAALTFLAWGLLNGVYIVAGAVTSPTRRRLRERVGLKEDSPITAALQTGVVFLLSMAAWVFFQSPSLAAAGLFFARLLRAPLWVHLSVGLDRWDALVALTAALVLFWADWAGQKKELTRRWLDAKLPLRWGAALVLLAVTVIFGCYGPGYDAQAFIYFQF